MSLQLRIFIMSFIPLLMLPVAIYIPWQDARDENNIQNIMLSNFEGNKIILDLVLNLQKERGRTGIAIQSGKKEDWNIVSGIKKETDILFQKLKESLQYLSTKNKTISLNLEEIRKKSEESLHFKDSFQNYSKLIDELIAIQIDLSNAPTTGGLGKQLVSLVSIEIANESAAKLRGYLSSLLAGQKPLLMEELQEVLLYKSYWETGISNPALTFSPENRNIIQSLKNDIRLKKVQNKVLDIIQESNQKTSYSISGDDFFKIITPLIDEVGTFSLKVTQDLLQEAQNRGEKLQKNFLILSLSFISVSIFLVILLLFLSFRLIRFIQKPIKDSSVSIQDIVEHLKSIVYSLAKSSDYLSQSVQKNAAALEETNASLEILSKVFNDSVNSMNHWEMQGKTAHEELVEMENRLILLEESFIHLRGFYKQIEGISEIIDHLSFETNLLSLNAAVEAARAGEHGRGFAVVAEAVRKLSLQSTEEAKRINDIVFQTIENTDESFIKLKKVKISSQTVIQFVRNIGTEIPKLAQEMRSQKESLSQILEALSQIDASIQSGTSQAEETQAVSQELTQKVSQLSDVVLGLQKLTGKH